MESNPVGDSEHLQSWKHYYSESLRSIEKKHNLIISLWGTINHVNTTYAYIILFWFALAVVLYRKKNTKNHNPTELQNPRKGTNFQNSLLSFTVWNYQATFTHKHGWFLTFHSYYGIRYWHFSEFLLPHGIQETFRGYFLVLLHGKIGISILQYYVCIFSYVG